MRQDSVDITILHRAAMAKEIKLRVCATASGELLIVSFRQVNDDGSTKLLHHSELSSGRREDEPDWTQFFKRPMKSMRVSA